ncbi:MAG: hypothetical protein J6Y60_14465 [Treponema sp.]|nr:hypothetical protein [Treponema sp.]
MEHTVFVFDISKGLKEHPGNKYEATRQYWTVKKWIDYPDMLAVGLVKQKPLSIYEIESWEGTDDETDIHGKSATGKFKFNGSEIKDSFLLDIDWKEIIELAKGFWQHGNFLVVSFPDENHFQILRGSKDKKIHSLNGGSK